MSIKLSFQIPVSALEQALQDGLWSGVANITLDARDVLKPVRRKAYSVPEDVQTLVELWNNHPYMKELERDRGGERRNLPMSPARVRSHIRTIKAAVRDLSTETISEEIKTYMERCSAGAHIQHGHNIAFTSLDTFCKKLVKVHKGLEVGWWRGGDVPRILDSHPEDTQLVADTYAQTFQGLETFPLKNPSPAYPGFHQSADLMLKTSARLEIPKEELIVMAVRFLQAEGNPRDLQRQEFWSDELPRHIKEHYPGRL